MMTLNLIATIHNGLINLTIVTILVMAILRSWVIYKTTNDLVYRDFARFSAVLAAFFFYLTLVTLHGQFMIISVIFTAIGATLRWLLVITGFMWLQRLAIKRNGLNEQAEPLTVEEDEA